MAAAAPSPLASSVEKTNGAKLSRLLIDGGTTVLRTIFDRYHPPANLLADLHANYLTLNNLLRKRVLHRPQWDLLFPPGGATPDSNTFDITLLFFLLTNICGLSRPLSFWHSKPPPSDTSLEANLARIKFFRNELYGHAATTGVDTPTFSALWLEISAVLVALGLHQAEIDRLKAERCGEEDYIDALLEWADSEEDIKSQLKDLHQSQIKVQQTVQEVHKTQLEDREILQDSKRKLEEVHRTQTRTQQTVDELHKNQLQDCGILQYGKGKLEEVHQLQTITQETIDEVRKSQLQDRKAIQDSNMKLQKVYQIDRKTHQVVTDVRQTQIDDSRAIQQMCRNTEKGVARLQKCQQEGHKTVIKSFEDLQQQLKQGTENLEGQREKHREDEILKKLAKVDSLRDMQYHAERYVEGTRVPIFAKVESWLNDRSSPNRVIVISGTAGMGKSVISAKMCQKMLETGRLAGSHFCQHDRARHRNPKVMLQSLASHLADSLPDYKKALVEKMSGNLGVEINDMEVKDLFELLFEEPLTALNDPGLTYLMVIDGIDESEYQGRSELLEVISNYFRKLPLWIRFLVTTRPEINIANRLKCLNPLELDPNNEENLKDIHLVFKESIANRFKCLNPLELEPNNEENLKDIHLVFEESIEDMLKCLNPLELEPNNEENLKSIQLCFKKQLSHVLQSEYQKSILQALVKNSEGVMLYAHYLIDFIKEEVPLLIPELLYSTIPSGISDVYHSYFKRLETDLRKQLNITDDQFMNFLSAVAAAREPLPLGFVFKLLLSGKSSSAVQRKVNAAIGCVSSLLPVQDGRIHFFHKSVKDWLIEKSIYGQHHFSVDEKEGHRVLSQLCIDELDDVKRKGVDTTQLGNTTKYALQNGVQHVLQLEEDARLCSLEEVVKKYCLELDLVYARLCVSVTAASEGIVCVQSQEGVKTLFEEWQRALDTLLHLLRKHKSTLTELPHAIFQTLLNEGGPELSPEAIRLLNTRYSEIPYMEFMHKKDLKVLVQSKFECSAKVVCFDVSPQLDYMACECQDGTIQLWSLHTGKLLWTKPVIVTKITVLLNDPNRIARTSLRLFPGVIAFYRSVVFHPTEDLVLPGILSDAYTFDGDLKPLFPSSKCRFLVCSISADKTKMLTDCPDNAKSIVMWSLKDGSEISNFACDKNVLSFAWSRDERLLAISHSPCSISLVDVLDGFKTLAEMATSKECGMIKFSLDCRFLFCMHSVIHTFYTDICELFRLRVNVENDCNFSLDVLPDELYYHPWESESCNDTGFLVGDPFCSPFNRGPYTSRPELAFVLNEHSLLRVSYCSSVVEMLDPDELTKGRGGFSRTTVREVVFSLNGDTLYAVTEQHSTQSILLAWDILNESSKAEKRVCFSYSVGFESFLVAVRAGVLLRTTTGTLELWNFELSECIRSWTGIGNIRHVIPMSEERVACDVRDSSKVIILDTTSGDIVSTITIRGQFVACNSQCQVITTERTGKLQMQCGENVLWKISKPFKTIPCLHCNTFSPSEKYFVVGGIPEAGFRDYLASFYVLDAVSGRTLHTLCTSGRLRAFNPDCKFVSNEECVVNMNDVSRGYCQCLRLFNVKFGELLSEITMESEVCSLAACPLKRLVAMGLRNSKHSFKLLHVKLPQDKSSRRNKNDGIKPQE
ncbi:uncharacterized protein LOC144659655 isoform X1 [Oculina patagonica]